MSAMDPASHSKTEVTNSADRQTIVADISAYPLTNEETHKSLTTELSSETAKGRSKPETEDSPSSWTDKNPLVSTVKQPMTHLSADNDVSLASSLQDSVSLKTFESVEVNMLEYFFHTLLLVGTNKVVEVFFCVCVEWGGVGGGGS
jgi:hypothetical protein